MISPMSSMAGRVMSMRERRDDDILVDELEEFAVRVIGMLLAGLFAFRKHLYYLNDHDINSNCYHFMMLNNS